MIFIPFPLRQFKLNTNQLRFFPRLFNEAFNLRQIVYKTLSPIVVSQDIRGMISSHKIGFTPLMDRPTTVANSRALTETVLQGKGSECEDNRRFNDFELLVKVRSTGLQFLLTRASIPRWPAFDRIGYINERLLETDLLESLPEELTGRTHERASLFVFLPSRSLTDDEDFSRGFPLREDNLCPIVREVTFDATGGVFFEFL